jgi:signal transduction histidine kinase
MILTVALFAVTVALARAHRDLHQAQSDLRAHALKLEETVHARTAKLTEVIGELEHMSYSIVHDLRAPLRAIQGFGGILEEEAGPTLSAASRGYVERMRTAANRMDMLIQDVLSYGKLVEQDLPLTTVDVVVLIRGIIDTYPALQPAAAEIKISPAIPPVKANAAALTHCLANLLINAVKFVAPGQLPKVEVTAERRDEDVEICVADQGIGIPADLLERVFGMFQRAHNGYEGTGMGLAIVRKAAERMGGSVRVESQVNAGSRFYLRLKAA